MKISTRIINTTVAASIALLPILAVAACDLSKLPKYPKDTSAGTTLDTYTDKSACTYSTIIDDCSGACKVYDQTSASKFSLCQGKSYVEQVNYPTGGCVDSGGLFMENNTYKSGECDGSGLVNGPGGCNCINLSPNSQSGQTSKALGCT